jgi:hypothetical protein
MQALSPLQIFCKEGGGRGREGRSTNIFYAQHMFKKTVGSGGYSFIFIIETTGE